MEKHINKSYTHVYPMIEDVVNYEDGLLGCYIGDVDHPEYDNHILLRYKFDGSLSSAYLTFEENVQKSEHLVDFYSIKDSERDTVMFVFQIPLEYKDDFDKFKQSKYSHFSEELKEKIISYHGVRKKNEQNKAVLTGILHRTKDYQLALEAKIDAKLKPHEEFSSIWEPAEEIFNKAKK